MSDEHQENLRDLAAMFAMVGLILKSKDEVDNLKEASAQANLCAMSFEVADWFMAARSAGVGIASAKRKRK